MLCGICNSPPGKRGIILFSLPGKRKVCAHVKGLRPGWPQWQLSALECSVAHPVELHGETCDHHSTLLTSLPLTLRSMQATQSSKATSAALSSGAAHGAATPGLVQAPPGPPHKRVWLPLLLLLFLPTPGDLSDVTQPLMKPLVLHCGHCRILLSLAHIC